MDLLIVLPLIFAALAGAGTYWLTRRDLSRQRATVISVGSAVAVGASFTFVLYLAVLAFVAAVAMYLLLRSWVDANRALAVSATTFTGLIAAGAMTFFLAQA